MKPHEYRRLNTFGKSLAGPLSRLVCNSKTERLTRLAEAYWCILQGKGAGSGWAMSAEAKAAQEMITGDAPVLFDVGANRGTWTAQLRGLFPTAKFFLFEPQPACLEILEQNRPPDSVLIPHAVSSVCGEPVQLYSSGKTDSKASLHQRRDSYFSDWNFSTHEATTVTLDDTIREYELDRVDFLKMDVEGHELNVLEGAKASLESGKIQALSFEFGSGNINSRTYFHDFWDLLHPLGFHVYRVLPSCRLMPITEYYEDCEYFRGVSNYVASLNRKN